jgi:hypothetical protein
MEWKPTDGVNVERIPNDAYTIVASFLQPKDLCHFGLACHEFYEIFEKEELWEAFFNTKNKTEYVKRTINKPGHLASTYKEAVILLETKNAGICGHCCKKINMRGRQRSRFPILIDETNIHIYLCTPCRKTLLPVRKLSKLTEEEKKQLTIYKRFGFRMYYDAREMRSIIAQRPGYYQNRNYNAATKTVSTLKRKLAHKNEVKKKLQEDHQIPEKDANIIANSSRFVQASFVTAPMKAYEYQSAQQEIQVLKKHGIDYTYEELCKVNKRYRQKGVPSYEPLLEKFVKKLKDNKEKKRLEEVREQAIQDKKARLEEDGYENLPPFCKSLLDRLDVEQVEAMIPREQYLMHKITKLGFRYDRLDYKRPRVVEYIQGSNFNTVDDIISELVGDHIKGEVTDTTRMSHMSIHDRIQVLKLMKNRNDWDEDQVRDFDKILAGIEMIGETCTGLLPEHNNKVNYQFPVTAMTFIEKGLQTMVDGVLGNMNNSAQLHEAIDEFIMLPEDRTNYLERKVVEFASKPKREKRKRGEFEEIESGDEETDSDDTEDEVSDSESEQIAKRVKTCRRSVSRFS